MNKSSKREIQKKKNNMNNYKNKNKKKNLNFYKKDPQNSKKRYQMSMVRLSL